MTIYKIFQNILIGGISKEWFQIDNYDSLDLAIRIAKKLINERGIKKEDISIVKVTEEETEF